MRESALKNIDLTKVKQLTKLKLSMIVFFFVMLSYSIGAQNNSFLLKIITQSSASEEVDVVLDETAYDFFRIGDRQFVYPSILWHDGSTYMFGDKTNTTYKNQIRIYQYNHTYGWFNYRDIGNGTDVYDEYNHPVPFGWVENGNIYAGQTNPHNEEIRIYKLNDTNVQNGWTEIASVGNDEAYPQVFKDLNGKTVFGGRDYQSTGTHHDLAVLVSDAGIDGTFTKTVFTYNDTDTPPVDYYRHYNCFPVLYGTQTVHYVFSTMRHDNAQEYFMHGVVKTSDWDNFSNYQETYSNQVSVDGRIDLSDWETNCVFNGSTAEDETNLNPLTSIQVNDAAYVIYKDETSEVYQIGKFEGTSFTSTVLDIDYLDHTQFYTPFMWYNGTNLVVSVMCDNAGSKSKELWGVSLALDTFTQKYVYANPTTYSRPILLPENLDEVNGQYAMVLDQATNEVTILLTVDKFRI